MAGTPREHADRMGTTVERLIEAITASGHTWHDFAEWVEFRELDHAGSVWMVGDAMPEWLADYLPDALALQGMA